MMMDDDDDEYMPFQDEDDDYYGSDEDDEDQAQPLDMQHLSFKKPTSQVITRESLLAAQKESLVRVMELVSVKENQARTLLIHYHWSFDTLLDVFAERGKDCLFETAGLALFESSSSSTKPICEICMEEDLPISSTTRMDCGHSFCNDCWREYFTVKIKDGGESKRIRCMAHKCNVVCDEDVVRSLVSHELAERFDRFLIESYVEDNKMVKWCPSVPHCGSAIRKLVDDGDDAVECSCGVQFCFSCLWESHSPCSCLMWDLWRKKYEEESATVSWITVNTKLCPKCDKPVHKTEGCNHMTCVCGQHFCWLCGQATGRAHDWSNIEGHSCGRYKDAEVQQLERAKRDKDRYMHYHHRYKAHMDSMKLEGKLRESVLEKAVSNSNSETKDQAVFREFSWVIDGVNALSRSRRILSYSYPFAFYMFGEELFKDEMSEAEREIKKNMFEDLQQQLEGNIEKLSKVLQYPFDEYGCKEATEMKNQIANLCNSVDHFCRKMYECIENDLLGSIPSGIRHNVAPYRSKGIEQAASFCV